MSSEPKKKRVIVIGGGIAGLAAAHRLLERAQQHPDSVEVLLFERQARLGGVVATDSREGFLLEAGSDSFITEKPWGIDLCRRLGLEEEFLETDPRFRKSFIVRENRLIPVPEGFYLLAPTRFWPFALSPFLSFRGKARVVLEWCIPKKKGLEDESVASFVKRRFGDEALIRIAQPMVGGVYGTDPTHLSIQATLPRFFEMEQRYGSVVKAFRAQRRKSQHSASGPRYGLFLSFKRGMQTLVDRLHEVLPEGAVRFNTQVTDITFQKEGYGWEVVLSNGESVLADAVCIALPAHPTSKILHTLDFKLAEDIAKIPYTSSATLNLAYSREAVRHPLNGFGMVVPAVEHHPILGCSFSSVKFPNRAPKGKVLLRVFLSEHPENMIATLSDQELIARACRSLKALLGITAPPLFTMLTRHPKALPQYRVGHLEHVRTIQSRLSSFQGIALAGNAYHGIGIPDCIHSGEEAADQLFAYLHNHHAGSKEAIYHASR